jgi:prohibitin 2
MAASEQEGKSTILGNISRNWPELKHQLSVFLIFFLLISLVGCAYFFNRIFVNIYPGQTGVLWQRFHGGTDMNYVYNEGLHILAPWDKMYIYDTRLQQQPYEFEALSKDGLPIIFELTVRYLPDRQHLPQLHVLVGPDYVLKVVKPEVQAHLRKVVANYLPDEIYTSEGYLLQIIMQGAMGAFAEKYIILDNILIRRMTLPKTIVDAIERKLTQEQYVQEYDYRLQVEEKEARRKGIEAEGIKRFEDIVKAGGFFDKYLQFKGIDATVDLAKSNNSKVVVIGGSGGNLPLIMNMDAAKAETSQPNPTAKVAGKPGPPQPAAKQPAGPEQESSFFSRLQSYLLGNKSQQASPEPSPDKE